MQTFVLSLIANDKIGIIDSLSKIIKAHNASWHASRFSELAGKFCGILVIECPSEQSAALKAALEASNNEDLTLQVEERHLDENAHEVAIIHILGNDKPGIIQEVTQLLTQFQLNIQSLKSAVNSSAMSGTPIFNAEITVETNRDIDWLDTSQQIEALASDLMVDIRTELESDD